MASGDTLFRLYIQIPGFSLLFSMVYPGREGPCSLYNGRPPMGGAGGELSMPACLQLAHYEVR